MKSNILSALFIVASTAIIGSALYSPKVQASGSAASTAEEAIVKAAASAEPFNSNEINQIIKSDLFRVDILTLKRIVLKLIITREEVQSILDSWDIIDISGLLALPGSEQLIALKAFKYAIEIIDLRKYAAATITIGANSVAASKAAAANNLAAINAVDTTWYGDEALYALLKKPPFAIDPTSTIGRIILERAAQWSLEKRQKVVKGISHKNADSLIESYTRGVYRSKAIKFTKVPILRALNMPATDVTDISLINRPSSLSGTPAEREQAMLRKFNRHMKREGLAGIIKKSFIELYKRALVAGAQSDMVITTLSTQPIGHREGTVDMNTLGVYSNIGSKDINPVVDGGRLNLEWNTLESQFATNIRLRKVDSSLYLEKLKSETPDYVKMWEDKKLSGLIIISANLDATAKTSVAQYKDFYLDRGYTFAQEQKLEKSLEAIAKKLSDPDLDYAMKDGHSGGDEKSWIHISSNYYSLLGTKNLPDGKIETIEILYDPNANEDGRRTTLYLQLNHFGSRLAERTKLGRAPLIYISSGCDSAHLSTNEMLSIDTPSLVSIGSMSSALTFKNKPEDAKGRILKALLAGKPWAFMRAQLRQTPSYIKNKWNDFVFPDEKRFARFMDRSFWVQTGVEYTKDGLPYDPVKLFASVQQFTPAFNLNPEIFNSVYWYY